MATIYKNRAVLLKQVLTGANAYTVLGVAPGADLATIKLAHRTLARMFHPDFNPGRTDAAAACAAVNVAWGLVSDPDSRRRLDTLLKPVLVLCPTCKGTGARWAQAGFKARVSVVCTDCVGNGLATAEKIIGMKNAGAKRTRKKTF